MNIPLRILLLCFSLLAVQCSKDILGVDDAGNVTGKTPPPAVIIKRSSQEDYNAKRFSSSKYSSSIGGTTGRGIFTVSYQDIYFDAAAGNPTDAVRPIVEKNLLLVGLTMQYQKAGKEGLQDFGSGTEVKFNDIELFSPANLTGAASQSGFFKRNFAFTREAGGAVSGAVGYDGSTEVYDKKILNFNYSQAVISIAHSDTVQDTEQPVSVNPAIMFDSGYVFNTAIDAVITLNRTIAKGSIISFEKVRGESSAYPYIASVVSYEVLRDTNVIRIPAEEMKYILDVLRYSTKIPKTFGVKYPFWLSIIESGFCDTLTLHHASANVPYQFDVYQYFEFGRKMYFK